MLRAICLVATAALTDAGHTGSAEKLLNPWQFEVRKADADGNLTDSIPFTGEPEEFSSNCLNCNVTDATNSSNTTDLLEEILESQGSTVWDIGMTALVLSAFGFGGWQGFKWLTSPKKTPAPLLADTELGEGDPVNSSDSTSLWMGGSGPARELMSGPSSSFTQF